MLFTKVKRRYVFVLWNWALFLFIILLLYPIGYGIFRLAIVILGFFLWLGAIFLFWNRKVIRLCCICLASIVSGITILPGYEVKGSTLREAYVQELNYYEGTKYVWGGENKFGIDCSGLVRRGLINASY
ncbi:NlpC/P60 family protein [Argonema antarcticum]|uniref:NlpC/P60 family protein n=1 Tax=Argonema antarcticum TaxID=2942763 RepID=UPI00201163A0|nr:NlpC/P60 family protein [Argonema antarcticum]MCL1470602.1 C40 family peptidase [Argonema antarcticum A004/B2]